MSTPPGDVTVATYNLYLGADLSLLFDVTSAEELDSRVGTVLDQLARTRFAERAAAIARVLAREQVDVVGLQEVSRWAVADLSSGGGVGPEQVVEDFLPALLAALARAGTPYDAHAVSPGFAGGLPVGDRWMSVTGNNGVLVRRGGAFTATAERAGTFRAGYAVRTGLDGVTFPITRGWGLVEGDVNGRRFAVANTHTEAYDAAVRDAQRDELVALVGDPGCPVAVVGDFNAVPGEVGMPEPYVDAWVAAGGDPAAGLTCGQTPELGNPLSDLRERIDYVFVRGAQVRDCRVVGHRGGDRTDGARLWPSDHAGVVARLGF